MVILGEMPKWAEDPVPCVVALETSLLRSASFRNTCRDKLIGFDKTYFRYYEEPADDLLRALAGTDGAVVWSPVNDMCTDTSCQAFVDGDFIYSNHDHLRRNLLEQTNRDLANMLHFGELMMLAKRK